MKKEEFLIELYDKIDGLFESEINKFEEENKPERISFKDIDTVISTLSDKFLQSKIRAYVAYLLQNKDIKGECYK